ncbi:hypothetical protein LguiA_020894 [Lonicera macranthoides]
MHETAEIFRIEANLTFDPEARPGIDVDDGFLHEWWLIFHDMFTVWQPMNVTQPNDGSSSMTEQAMRQQSAPSSLRERQLNEEMIKELTISSDMGIIIGGNLVPSMGSPSIQTEQISQDSTSTSPQKKAPKPAELSGHIDDKVAPKMENIASSEGGDLAPELDNKLDLFYVAEDPKESGRKRKNSVDSEDGSNGMHVASTSFSEASSPCSPFDENEDEGRTSINSPTPSSSVGSDDSNAHTVVESKRMR